MTDVPVAALPTIKGRWEVPQANLRCSKLVLWWSHPGGSVTLRFDVTVPADRYHTEEEQRLNASWIEVTVPAEFLPLVASLGVGCFEPDHKPKPSE